MIEVNGLRCGYGKETVLQNVGFTAETGRVTTLIGPNGCGKSTLLKALCGALPLMDGTVLLDGAPVHAMKERQIARQIAYLSQGKNIPDISVARFVLHGRFPYLEYPRRYQAADFEAAEDAMRRMGVLEWRDRTLRTLSGGMRQKVYIAMALCQQAPVILMDEPTTYLDIRQQRAFAGTARMLRDDGKTLVLVLHDLPAALKISDKIVALDGGTLAACGTPAEILSGGVIERIYGVRVKAVEDGETLEYYYSEIP